jgi:hypothetical protein
MRVDFVLQPTGAVVAQQPFGGARSSGTNDKVLNLLVHYFFQQIVDRNSVFFRGFCLILGGICIEFAALGLSTNGEGDFRSANTFFLPLHVLTSC